MHASWAAIRAKFVAVNAASGASAVGLDRVGRRMSDQPGLVNQRVKMLRCQSEKATQAQKASRAARYDEIHYRPVCYRERVYERTWPEYDVEEEPHEHPKEQPKANKRHRSQTRRAEWAESRRGSR